VKAAVDTNVLAYAEGIDDDARARAARQVLNRVVPTGAVVAVQTLGELFNVLCRKGKYTPVRARQAVSEWQGVLNVVATTPDLFAQALSLSVDHHLNIWDSIILSAASHSGCQMLLSEDLREGFVWGGVTVLNPFAQQKHAMLVTLLAG
jgi:predicted nucleic acid-binding protein